MRYGLSGRLYPRLTISALPVVLDQAGPKAERLLLVVLDTVVMNPVGSNDELRASVESYHRDFSSRSDMFLVPLRE